MVIGAKKLLRGQWGEDGQLTPGMGSILVEVTAGFVGVLAVE